MIPERRSKLLIVNICFFILRLPEVSFCVQMDTVLKPASCYRTLEKWRVRNINPSAWGHLNPSSYCDVGRLFYGVFKLLSKLQRKK